MAVPKRRTSKTKKRMRRTHLVKTAPNMTVCPNCGASLKPHRVCTECGYYKNKEVIAMSESSESEN